MKRSKLRETIQAVLMEVLQTEATYNQKKMKYKMKQGATKVAAPKPKKDRGEKTPADTVGKGDRKCTSDSCKGVVRPHSTPTEKTAGYQCKSCGKTTTGLNMRKTSKSGGGYDASPNTKVPKNAPKYISKNTPERAKAIGSKKDGFMPKSPSPDKVYDDKNQGKK